MGSCDGAVEPACLSPEQDGPFSLSDCVPGALEGSKAAIEAAVVADVRRRQQAVAAAVLIRDKQRRRRVKPRSQFSEPFSWASHLAKLTDHQFRLRYRLTPRAFQKLLTTIIDDLVVKDETRARAAKWGNLIEPAVKLAVTLRYLAGGQVRDLMLIYDLSHTQCYVCIWKVVDAVNFSLPIEFPIDDPEKLRLMEVEFRARSRCQGAWTGQVGCLDGVHFAMRQPPPWVPNGMKYYVHRKGKFALLCMALCDAKRRFTMYDISQTPTTHDSLAWEATALAARISAGELPYPYFILGDAAFAVSAHLITPTGEKANDNFDFHQSSNRMPIECAFGMLVRRFGILWRSLEMRFDRRAAVVGACMRLHNFCIDHNVLDVTPEDASGLSEFLPGRWQHIPQFNKHGAPVEYLDTGCPRPQQSLSKVPSSELLERRKRRNELIEAVEASGIVRPVLDASFVRRAKKPRGATHKRS